MHAVVVGAGIIGLTTAWRLSQRGWSVTIVDPQPGEGASHAAAGMLAPASEVIWGQTLLSPLMTASAELYPAFAEELATASGSDLGVTDAETFVCAADAADMTSLRELCALQNALGLPVELIAGSRARSLEPAIGPGVSAAVRIPGDHAIDPRRVVAALISVLGDNIVRCRVDAVISDGTQTRGIALANGQNIQADQVVVCAGVGASTIEGLPALGVRPVWGDIMRLSAPESLRPLVTRTIRALVNGRPVYLVPRPDGSLVLGATSREDGRGGLSAGGVHRLLHDIERVVPGALECEITDVTARARPGSPDDIPIIGRIDDGCVVSTGYFRHGILLAPLGAQLTADITTGDASDADLPRTVDPHRFTTATHDPAPTTAPESAHEGVRQ
ncbi:glycine oxidase ThiO [Microbacterium sp. MPKO10]|uniref:glycine oxidase ThiO n=1 Tax=Microbacterium sp. MPKO10 TaxID=2989818 RepID=UPI002235EC71|nr:glycine oxidase ThiO [Microbacterium sp. MPKO10]MCW4458042.1 glycine oxidase ThiO [Microbacterium sp. MPKO10]